MFTDEMTKSYENGEMIPVVWINCHEYPFCDSILDGFKIYETRTRNTLCDLVGKTCLFCETGNGKPVTRFYARIDSVTRIDSAEDFEKYRNGCDILPGTRYDWTPGTRHKYLYHLTDITGEDRYNLSESCLIRHGISWAEYYGH